jgi:hypothetical protein
MSSDSVYTHISSVSEGSLIGKLAVFGILVTAVVHTAFAVIFTGITVSAHPEFEYWTTHLKWNSTTGLTCAAVGDVIIAVAMVYFLSVRRTAFMKSRNLVNKLMLYSVESGALTSVVALIAMVTFLVSHLGLYVFALPHNCLIRSSRILSQLVFLSFFPNVRASTSSLFIHKTEFSQYTPIR